MTAKKKEELGRQEIYNKFVKAQNNVLQKAEKLNNELNKKIILELNKLSNLRIKFEINDKNDEFLGESMTTLVKNKNIFIDKFKEINFN